MFCFNSCHIMVTWFKPKNFTFLYEEQNTGIDTLINVDGYYYSDSIPFNNFYLLYRDGSIRNTSEKGITKSNHKYSASPVWGVYKIMGDTITSQLIMNFGGSRDMGVKTDKFIIKSKNELEYYSTSCCNSNPNDVIIKQSLYFYSYPNRSDSAHWVKNHRWFWKDKETYKEYKKRKKQ